MLLLKLRNLQEVGLMNSISDRLVYSMFTIAPVLSLTSWTLRRGKRLAIAL